MSIYAIEIELDIDQWSDCMIDEKYSQIISNIDINYLIK